MEFSMLKNDFLQPEEFNKILFENFDNDRGILIKVTLRNAREKTRGTTTHSVMHSAVKQL